MKVPFNRLKFALTQLLVVNCRYICTESRPPAARMSNNVFANSYSNFFFLFSAGKQRLDVRKTGKLILKQHY